MVMVDASSPSIPDVEKILSLSFSVVETIDMVDGSGGDEVVVGKTNIRALVRLKGAERSDWKRCHRPQNVGSHDIGEEIQLG
ncbi:hypothetical protein PIB30_029710 [Stylosanthes scabra]|uniref:Uncharacterized protein n=1 Tax=Stylosanthes scabra TaxID=79078 RepID=A0ABU6XD08_9FABA|nr:hypothetical protein [Stylosanthes scabra]